MVIGVGFNGEADMKALAGDRGGVEVAAADGKAWEEVREVEAAMRGSRRAAKPRKSLLIVTDEDGEAYY